VCRELYGWFSGIEWKALLDGIAMRQIEETMIDNRVALTHMDGNYDRLQNNEM
jgi:hypothetical protein